MPFLWLSKWGAGLLQKTIQRDQSLSFANDYPEGSASCKWAWASDDSVGTEPPRGPDTWCTLLHMCTLMEGDETQHDTRPHICFFGLYTCVLVRLFSLCASFMTFLDWFWLLLLLHNLLYAAWVSSYSSEDNNEVITQISRYLLSPR